MRIIPRKSVAVTCADFSLFLEALRQRKLLYGEETAIFEAEFARYIGVKHAISISSARLGIRLSLEAIGASPGDEVILSAYNFPVIPDAIKKMGLEPAFVDIDPRTYNIDAGKIERRIGPKTKYILATHMFGQPADLETILGIAGKYGLKVIEDCAHACGSEYRGRKAGSFGDAACFSFGIGKALVCFGGGMITTDSDNLDTKIRERLAALEFPHPFSLAKNILFGFVSGLCTKRPIFSLFVYPFTLFLSIFGRDPEELLDSFEYRHKANGREMRFTNAQAAIGRRQLERLDLINGLKIKHSERLSGFLSGMGGLNPPQVLEGVKHAYLYYPVNTDRIRDFKKYLTGKGIDTKVSMQRDCSGNGFSRTIDGKVLELPNGYNLKGKDMDYICTAIAGYFKEDKKA
ncbi:MAG: aminotransferase class I/II-fold pyridoxal phosphate-dependent enzyme [Candidatus Omnitrophica bacterium]|nr:aminotransferase class I/II-fold pyridoxal phosphate-dependent enzyme [Candidatus Omnitrophota bacterium]